MRPFSSSSSPNLAYLIRSFRGLISSLLHTLIFRVHPFWIQLHYFIISSLIGYLALKASKPRTTTTTTTTTSSFEPKDLDLFFTSVSATTVSSMSTVEMEVFSNTQLIFLTILMLLGGEVFTSLLGLQFQRYKLTKHHYLDPNNSLSTSSTPSPHDQIELNLVDPKDLDDPKQPNTNPTMEIIVMDNKVPLQNGDNLRYKSIKCLGYVVLFYLLVVHIGGSTLVSMYINLIPSAREVLKQKDLHIQTFSIFTTVSTFANCGYVPTNENMIVFIKNSGLLWILMAQVLLGNTLYPVCLRFVIWVLERITRREELRYILRNCGGRLGYGHGLSGLQCWCLGGTVFGFVAVQFAMFCSMEWQSEGMDGLDWYQKVVASLFQVVNSRHAGESVVDLSTISKAILVVFVVMMYLPPYTSFLPFDEVQENVSTDDKKSRRQRKTSLDLVLSQLSYLAIFIVLICITEREKLKEDPLNFNVLNITIEVISAYGNVGFSTGYSCKRQLNHEDYCRDTWSGFAGRWSEQGKIVLIIVMFFGRLKKFNMDGGQAWKLS